MEKNIPKKRFISHKSSPTPRQPIRYLIISFFVPFLILGTTFAALGVHPFGNNQILVTDFWHQYFPFLSDMWYKLRDGNSFLWSWKSTGINYLSQTAYYTASPLNFLIVLFPHKYLREVITVILMTKIGFAGMFYSMFLRSVFHRNDISLVTFSAFYALCSFSLGYYWNIMWYDTFAVMPLVAWGLISLLTHKKFLLYTLSLCCAVAFNYYMGLFACFFSVIIFIVWFFTAHPGFRVLWNRLWLTALCSAVGIGLTAPLTFPAFRGLQTSSGIAGQIQLYYKFYEKATDLIGNMIAFTPPTSLEGLPNLGSGILCVVLAGFYLFNTRKNVRISERICLVATLIFLVFSMNYSVLNYFWHGMHFTNMIPHRFAFLFSFILIFMAYRGFVLLHPDPHLPREKWEIPFIGAIFLTAAVLICAYLGVQENNLVMINIILVALYAVIILLFKSGILKPLLFNFLIFFVAICEISASAAVGVNSVGFSVYNLYPDKYNAIEGLLARRTDDSEPFYRTELARLYGYNNPTMYNFDGISLFSSSANMRLTQFYETLGVSSWDYGNRYTYIDSTPMTDIFLNMRYLMYKYAWDLPATVESRWEKAARFGDSILMRNDDFFLPLGFMVRPELLKYGGMANTFDAQNDFFYRATAIPQPLYTKASLLSVNAPGLKFFGDEFLGNLSYSLTDRDTQGFGTATWRFLAPADGPIYFVIDTNDDINNVTISRKGSMRTQSYGSVLRRTVTLPGGVFKKGDVVQLALDFKIRDTVDNTSVVPFSINVASFDELAFKKGYYSLRDEVFNISHFSDTYIKGQILATENGAFYTSIPYEKGWHAYVDGKERKIQPIMRAMLAFPLSKGSHTIELRYFSNGLPEGILIFSLSFLILLTMLWLSYLRIPRLTPKPIRPLPHYKPFSHAAVQAKAHIRRRKFR